MGFGRRVAGVNRPEFQTETLPSFANSSPGSRPASNWSSTSLSIAISMVLPVPSYGLAHKITDRPRAARSRTPFARTAGSRPRCAWDASLPSKPSPASTSPSSPRSTAIESWRSPNSASSPVEKSSTSSDRQEPAKATWPSLSASRPSKQDGVSTSARSPNSSPGSPRPNEKAAFGNACASSVVPTALLDRLLHHAVVFQIEGSSYRLRQHAALSRKAIGRQSRSVSAWILVVRPPRERPMA